MTDFDETPEAPGGLTVETNDDYAPFTVLALSGELDLQTASQVREVALDLIRQGRDRLVVDLRRVRFIDSIGLSVLLLIRNRLGAINGDLALVCDQPHVLRIFEMVGLATVFRLFRTIEEAAGWAA
ncbi:MAG TPA: STAS domain-containing protein [Acidimicrobiales bacterium]|nr:STAS domain-containing protein [Acidimicrobiales bacterium]